MRVDGEPRHQAPVLDPRLRAHVQKVWLPEGDDRSPLSVTLGAVPPGHVLADEYAVLPHPRMARFLVPLVSRRVAAATLHEYNATRGLLSRTGRLALAGGYRLGVTGTLLRHRLVVSVDARVPRHRWGEHLVTRRLAQDLDRPVHAFTALRMINPNAKPTLELFDDQGAPVGYAKLGTTDATRQLVRNEAATVGELAGGFDQLVVPRLLAAAEWGELAYTLVEPLPRDVRRWTGGVEATVGAIRQVAGSGRTSAGPLAGSPFAARLHRELAALDSQEAAAPLRRWLHRLEEDPVPVRLGRSHGDWIPDNLGRCGSGFAAWDWEHSSAESPVGFDLLQWHFHHSFVAADLPAAVAAVETAIPQLALLDVPHEARRQVASTYLLDLVLRRHRLASGGGGWNRKWYPAVVELLRRPEPLPVTG